MTHGRQPPPLDLQLPQHPQHPVTIQPVQRRRLQYIHRAGQIAQCRSHRARHRGIGVGAEVVGFDRTHGRTVVSRSDNIRGPQLGVPCKHEGMRRASPYGHGELVVVIDCSGLDRSAAFWCAVLGYEPDGPVHGPFLSLVPADGEGAEVLLQRVAEAKDGKNRLHLDLRTGDLAAELQRAQGLGAVVLTRQPVVEAGWQWHVLADPDGNEFCILQPPASYRWL